jgi:hypothetical protein
MSQLIHQSLRESLFQTLKNDATLNSLVQGVFGEMPESQSYPYIVIGEMASRDWSTRTSLGFVTSVVLDCYGQEGSTQIEAINGRVHFLLTSGLVTLLDHKLVGLRVESHETALQADGVTYQGKLTFRAYSEFIPV